MTRCRDGPSVLAALLAQRRGSRRLYGWIRLPRLRLPQRRRDRAPFALCEWAARA